MDKPCVLLYNPISGHGHYDSWLGIVAVLLIKRGYTVHLLTEAETAILKTLTTNGYTKDIDFTLLPWNDVPAVSTASFKESVKPPSSFAQFLQPYRRFAGRVKRKLIYIKRRTRDHCIHWPTLFYHWMLKRKKTSNFASGCLQERIVRAYTVAKVKKADVLFIMALEAFNPDFDLWKSTYNKTVQMPFGGICISYWEPPQVARKAEGWFQSPWCGGACYLMEEGAIGYAKLFPHKKFPVIPDIANAALPEKEPDIVTQIRSQAAGRTIVVLGGALNSRKNFPLLAGLAEKAPEDKWFFVVIGRLYIGSFTEKDNEAFTTLKKSSNVFIYDNFLPEEEDFNAVFAASDIIFAVYKDFVKSSNMVSKSAKLGKSLLVANTGLMEQLVTQYNLGKAVDSDDVNEAWGALQELQKNPVSAHAREKYLEQFSEEKMGDIIGGFIDYCAQRKLV